VNQGTVAADTAGGQITLTAPGWKNIGTIDGQTGNIGVSGGLTVDGAGILAGHAAGVITVSGNVGGTTTNADRYIPLGKVLLNGPGNATNPQFLEVMSQDRGTDSKGFSHNFAYGTLALGNNTYARLVDTTDNAAGTGPEALYAISLVVPT